MNHAELQKRISETRRQGHCFIKWWGDDTTLFDYELLDRFMARGETAGEVAGFELFDLEGMWNVLRELDPDPLQRVAEAGQEMIRWNWKDTAGKEHTTRFPFTPEGVMELMESEFFD